MVLNVSEMEAKVREATNDEPWCVVSYFACLTWDAKESANDWVYFVRICL